MQHTALLITELLTVFLALLLIDFLATGCQTSTFESYAERVNPMGTGSGGNCFGGVGPPHTSCLNNNANFVSFGNLNPEYIVSLHNAIRANVNPRAKEMEKLVWNPILAFLAQRWAAQCKNSSERMSYRSIPGIWDYVGQNVYDDTATTSVDFLNNAFKKWTAESASFTYGSDSMSYSNVGRYTQIIWAPSVAIGCAIALCSNPTAVHYVCNYAPGGFFSSGRNPFAYPYNASTTNVVAG